MPHATPADVARAHRILCYGVTGSGKSTAAGRIGRALDLPVHLVDEEIGWLPGWVPREPEQMRAIAAEIVASDRWVLDSTYSAFAEVVLPRVEVMVALDYPRWLSLGRLLRRTVTRAALKTEMCNGNTESWRQAFSKDSIVRWHFRSFTRKRERMRAWEQAPDGIPVLRLSHPRELDALVRGLERRPGASTPRR